jgi:RNA polymerase sigma factor (TIGR02999 family)
MEPDSGKITRLLKAWGAGDTAAREELIPLVYNKLRQLAQYYRRSVAAGDTLQTTALVHEAYLRMVNIEGITWRDRAHFFAVSAQLMRRILVDAARAQAAVKRGGPQNAVDWLELDGLPAPESSRTGELVALDDALTSLTQLDPRRASVVELRVFGGLTVDETAQALDLSPQSVMRDWKVAKAWLLRELSNQNGTQDES